MTSGPAAPIVAIAMQKGGVGKTTSTYHLARGAVLAGRRALVVDLDPQGNVTSALASMRPDRKGVSIADALDPGENCSVEDVLIPSIWHGVDVAPSTGETLYQAEQHVGAMRFGREARLRAILEPVRPLYDLILLDCPPNLGQLTVNAFVAADSVVVVFQAEQFSLDGLDMLRDTVNGVRQSYNPDLTWAGVLVNGWRGTKTNEECLAELRENFSDAEVWPYKIPQWVGIGDSSAAATALDEWPGTKYRILAQQYRVWAEELIGS